MEVLKIINHYGEKHQIKKLAEEQFELIEALLEKDKEHIKEEIADNIHIMWQFMAYYDLSITEVLDEVERKNKRTLRRMEDQWKYLAKKNL